MQHSLKTCCAKYHPIVLLLIFCHTYIGTVVDASVNVAKVSSNEINVCASSSEPSVPPFLLLLHLVMMRWSLAPPTCCSVLLFTNDSQPKEGGGWTERLNKSHLWIMQILSIRSPITFLKADLPSVRAVHTSSANVVKPAKQKNFFLHLKNEEWNK